MNIGWLMGSLVIVETVFSYPGLGRTMVFAVSPIATCRCCR